MARMLGASLRGDGWGLGGLGFLGAPWVLRRVFVARMLGASLRGGGWGLGGLGFLGAPWGGVLGNQGPSICGRRCWAGAGWGVGWGNGAQTSRKYMKMGGPWIISLTVQ